MIERISSRKLVADYYRDNLAELRAFVRKSIVNDDGAEDIVQNVFLRLLTSEKMISEVTLPCLVYTVARNLITDRIRHFSIADRLNTLFPTLERLIITMLNPFILHVRLWRSWNAGQHGYQRRIAVYT